MPSARIATAYQLVADCQAALADAGLTQAVATLDANDIASASRYGVVVVSPPSLSFETWGDPVALWELHVIAGPADNYLAAWETIDTLIQALSMAQINLKDAEPGSFQTLSGPPLPAYTLTLNPLD